MKQEFGVTHNSCVHPCENKSCLGCKMQPDCLQELIAREKKKSVTLLRIQTWMLKIINVPPVKKALLNHQLQLLDRFYLFYQLSLSKMFQSSSLSLQKLPRLKFSNDSYSSLSNYMNLQACHGRCQFSSMTMMY